MAKVTWLGEDTEKEPGPSYNTWNGIRFPKGQAVEITDEAMLATARTNQFYRVVEGKAHEEKAFPEHAQETVEKVERIKKEYHYREAEKVSGYKPKKKRAAKKLPAGGVAEGVERGPDNQDQDAH